MTDGSMSPLAQGEAVRAFYHMNDHPNGFRYVRLLDVSPEEVPEEKCAAVGLSTGWIPATVALDWQEGGSGEDQRVLVKLHGHFADAYQQDPEPVVGMYWKVPRAHVRPMGAKQPATELSLLVVRWWDYWNPRNRKSKTHNVANEEMLLDVLQGSGSPHNMFGTLGAYEVHSAFVRKSADLALVGTKMARAMRGRRRAGLYFLWPTQRPHLERQLAGAVSEKELMSLMQGMEGAGVRTCWPHPTPLYRMLAGKCWPHRVCVERPDLHVPPTVQLDMASWHEDPFAVAGAAIAELQRLAEAVPQSRRPPLEEPFRGVVKLGFSWMGEDVRPFAGAAELVKVTTQMLDGAIDPICLVQLRIPDVTCELRFVCCRDLASGPTAVTKELVRMRLHDPRMGHDTFRMASHMTMNSADAAQYAFGGSAQALAAAEGEARRLTDLWFEWLREEGHGTPAACRVDFMVSLKPSVSLWTVELCECGGSLCLLTHHARTTACLNECLFGDGQGSDGAGEGSLVPQPLPPMRAVAYGENGGAGGGGSGRRQGGSWHKVSRGPDRSQSVRPSTVIRALTRLRPSALAAILAVVGLLLLRLRRR